VRRDRGAAYRQNWSNASARRPGQNGSSGGRDMLASSPGRAVGRNRPWESAERLGYDAGWVRTRHLEPYLSAPLPFFAALAQRTERITFGASVVPIRYENPVRPAGRLSYGAGRLATAVRTGGLGLGLQLSTLSTEITDSVSRSTRRSRSPSTAPRTAGRPGGRAPSPSAG
jgi:Luciferase-like monooxygenase